MFEKIILRRSDQGAAITLGELAEALLFYQNIHIILDQGSLIGIVNKIGTSSLISLLSRPNISAVYCDEILAVRTENNIPFNMHSFNAIKVVGSDKEGEIKSKKKRLEFILESKGINKKEAKRFTEKFLQLAPIKHYSSDHFIPGGLINAAEADLNDPIYVKEAIRHTLNNKLELPIEDFRFEVVKQPDKFFYIITDLDYPSLGQQLKNDEARGSFSEAHLLNEILHAKSDIILAGHYGGEFYTSSNTSEIICLRYSFLMRRMKIANSERRDFMNMVVSDGCSLREVINSGEKSFTDFLKLLDAAERFKDWIKNVNPDDKLVAQYIEDISKRGWLEQIPTKIVRYIIASALGGITSTIVEGLALSALDSFLVDKLFSGWRPNHFVNGNLKPFFDNE